MVGKRQSERRWTLDVSTDLDETGALFLDGAVRRDVQVGQRQRHLGPVGRLGVGQHVPRERHHARRF